MFRQRTVFILGAGASWHYGYPTGEKVVTDVIEEAEVLANHFTQWRFHGQFLSDYANAKKADGSPNDPASLNSRAKSDCDELARKLRAVNPVVIDYFLGWNSGLKEIGRFVIALVILKAEAQWAHLRHNRNRALALKESPYPDERDRRIDASKFKDDWCRFVINQLVSGSSDFQQILDSPVSFITFNYDTSLERRLDQGLRSLEMFHGKPIEQFFTNERFVHVYGQVGSYDQPPPPVENIQVPSGNNDINGLRRYTALLNGAYDAGQKISTIDPNEKDGNQEKLGWAKELLREAEQGYILGYGFDPSNNDRLGLGSSLLFSTSGARPTPTVRFTNFQDSNRVNGRASQVLFGDSRQFRPGVMTHHHVTRSIRDVYAALELDFELPG